MAAPVEGELRFLFPFRFLDTHDLGCFIRQSHEFRPDHDFLLCLEPAPWQLAPLGPVSLPHQAYFPRAPPVVNTFAIRTLDPLLKDYGFSSRHRSHAKLFVLGRSLVAPRQSPSSGQPQPGGRAS
jgi:hypothetical protein